MTGIDLVRTQLDIAGGRTLEELGLIAGRVPSPRGIALQLRVNAETMSADGIVRPASGMLDAFDPPAGPGVRVDTCGHGGFRVNPRFDSLLAKVIVHVTPGDLSKAAAKARRALSEFRISGVSSNREFLLNLLSSPDFVGGQWYTGFIDDNLASLCAPSRHPRLYGEPSNASAARHASRSHRSARNSDSWQAGHGRRARCRTMRRCRKACEPSAQPFRGRW